MSKYGCTECGLEFKLKVVGLTTQKYNEIKHLVHLDREEFCNRSNDAMVELQDAVGCPMCGGNVIIDEDEDFIRSADIPVAVNVFTEDDDEGTPFGMDTNTAIDSIFTDNFD